MNRLQWYNFGIEAARIVIQKSLPYAERQFIKLWKQYYYNSIKESLARESFLRGFMMEIKR